MRRDAPRLLHAAVVLLLFFASGALGLIYEVVWSRMMMHVFGSTAIAVGTVLAAFMSGLAALRDDLSADHRAQLRWETYAHDALDDIARWLK